MCCGRSVRGFGRVKNRRQAKRCAGVVEHDDGRPNGSCQSGTNRRRVREGAYYGLLSLKLSRYAFGFVPS